MTTLAADPKASPPEALIESRFFSTHRGNARHVFKRKRVLSRNADTPKKERGTR